MTSFEIETGMDDATARQVRFGRMDAIMWDIIESLPADATQSQIDGAAAQIVMGEIRKPKRLATMRRHFVALWPMIAPLALTSPESFDEIISEYACRASELG